MKDRENILKAMRTDKAGGIKLSKAASDSTKGVKDKEEARKLLAENTAAIAELQYKLYAEAATSLLIVFQAMDTAGKDGVIRNVFGPINPQGVRVESFKKPTEDELAHDYLWRVHQRTPARGMIAVFNRSQYEDVLVHKVHKLLPEKQLDQRYRQINDFERLLAENGAVIRKFFLHISPEEQRERLQARLDDKDKRWKFRLGDLKERELWDDYMRAYQAALDQCSSKHAPWYVIPADKKWYRDWAVSSIILDTLRGIDPKIPKSEENLDGVVVD